MSFPSGFRYNTRLRACVAHVEGEEKQAVRSCLLWSIVGLVGLMMIGLFGALSIIYFGGALLILFL